MMITMRDETGNMFGDRGAIAVAEIISHMLSLQKLGLNCLMMMINEWNEMKTTRLVLKEQLQLVIILVH